MEKAREYLDHCIHRHERQTHLVIKTLMHSHIEQNIRRRLNDKSGTKSLPVTIYISQTIQVLLVISRYKQRKTRRIYKMSGNRMQKDKKG